MKRPFFLIAGLALALAGVLWISNSNLAAQEAGSGFGVAGFADENGDGINDNAPDSDGDGIPNGQDPDYERPDGSRQGRRGMKAHGVQGFVDEDGDGVNDNAPDSDGDGIRNCEDPDYTPKAGARGIRRVQK